MQSFPLYGRKSSETKEVCVPYANGSSVSKERVRIMTTAQAYYEVYCAGIVTALRGRSKTSLCVDALLYHLNNMLLTSLGTGSITMRIVPASSTLLTSTRMRSD